MEGRGEAEGRASRALSRGGGSEHDVRLAADPGER